MRVPSADAVHDVAQAIAARGEEPVTIAELATLSGYSHETTRAAVIWLLRKGRLRRERVKLTFAYWLIALPLG